MADNAPTWTGSTRRRRCRLHSYEECAARQTRAFAENFRRHRDARATCMEPHSDTGRARGRPLRGGQPRPTRRSRPKNSTASFDLPYERAPHPRYRGKGRHPGVGDDQALGQHPPGLLRRLRLLHHFGASGQVHPLAQSERSILDEVRRIAATPDFRGYLSDVGAPVGQHVPHGRARPRALRPQMPAPVVPAPDACAQTWATTTGRCSALYAKIRAVKGIKKAFVGSGIRYDLFDGSDYLETVVRASHRRDGSKSLPSTPRSGCSH